MKKQRIRKLLNGKYIAEHRRWWNLWTWTAIARGTGGFEFWPGNSRYESCFVDSVDEAFELFGNWGYSTFDGEMQT